jgi:hypothetical protein
MARAIGDLRDSMNKVQAINEETWSRDAFNVQLTQALTTLENARMEWNSARLKFAILSGEAGADRTPSEGGLKQVAPGFPGLSMGELCKLGLALTWPVAIAILVTGVVLLALLLRA